jgi:ATP/maltotriose-dependent transcriptional regulator MalT/DNA-binding SARP family transcriptional activator
MRVYHRPTPTRLDKAVLESEPGGHVERTWLTTRISEALDSGGVLLIAGPGYGKTTVLDQALGRTSTPVGWIRCSEAERAPGTLLMRILDSIAGAVPGASDVLSERLASAPEQVDALAGARELLAELPRLLVDPLCLVVDDAEHLDGAEGSLRLLGKLIRAELPSLHLAIASRRPLDLRVAKPRAAGRLAELTATDLAFGVEECASLLCSRTGRDPSPREVEMVMEATEGWPLGIALTVAGVDRARRGSTGAGGLRNLRSAPEVRSFLSEELLESLDPELREGAIESSVARVVSEGVTRALNLPDGFDSRIERAGMLIRRVEAGDGFAYHPLLREFLLERLEVERGDEEWRRLHRTVAPAVTVAGDPIEGIEHWLQAQDWEEAAAAIEREAPALVRTSAGLVRRWLSLLPAEAQRLPTIRSLEGQLEWGAGDHPRAAELLRDAIAGFRERPNPPAEWLARFVLVDSLFAIGEFEELGGVIAGWDGPTAAAAGVLAPAAALYVAVALATIGRFEESDRLAAPALRHHDAALLGPVEALRISFRDTPPGHLDQVLAGMRDAVDQLERFDPFNRRLYFQATLAFMYAERGHTDQALEIWMRVREGAGDGSGPFLVDTTYAWCAELYAQQGRLAEAEAELAHYEGQEISWRTCIGDLAKASVASLRGDAAATIAHADRALAVVAKGPGLFIHRTAADLVPALASVGRPARAQQILDDTFALVDEIYPDPLGRFPRGRLVALRAWLRHIEGDAAGADADLRLFWEEAGETLRHTLRREWVRLREPVWAALERGALDPAATVETIAAAFPERLPLVAFLDHPSAAVRRAALAPATESGDPGALAQLGRLVEDPDAGLAAAASQALERLATTLPPLGFELLGSFAVRRGSWRSGEAWERPVDARLVRFLLVHLEAPVPEDLIFAALWPELSASSARSSLQVAASRARRLLDPPGRESSMLVSDQRCYRLILGEHDAIDAEQFRTAATVALAEEGKQRGRLLEHAHSLWGGEPLPEERYCDWATAYRERLIDRYTAVLAALVELHEDAGNHAGAAEIGRELVDLDPLNEGGHRALITAYARSGRTGYALRQYLECRRALVEQLGVEPAAATSCLQARVLAGEPI